MPGGGVSLATRSQSMPDFPAMVSPMVAGGTDLATRSQGAMGISHTEVFGEVAGGTDLATRSQGSRSRPAIPWAWRGGLREGLTPGLTGVQWAPMVERQTERIAIRLTPTESKMLQELSDLTGLNLTDFLRQAIRKEHAERFGELKATKKPKRK